MAIFSFIPKFDSAVWIKINCALTSIAVIFLIINYIDRGLRYHELAPEFPRPLKVKGKMQVPQKHFILNLLLAFSGCCTFPCVKGVCISLEGNDYTCNCPNSNYFGKNCENGT